MEQKMRRRDQCVCDFSSPSVFSKQTVEKEEFFNLLLPVKMSEKRVRIIPNRASMRIGIVVDSFESLLNKGMLHCSRNEA